MEWPWIILSFIGCAIVIYGLASFGGKFAEYSSDKEKEYDEDEALLHPPVDKE